MAQIKGTIAAYHIMHILKELDNSRVVHKQQ